jgi:hypothetical protein
MIGSFLRFSHKSKEYVYFSSTVQQNFFTLLFSDLSAFSLAPADFEGAWKDVPLLFAWFILLAPFFGGGELAAGR